MEEVFIKQEYYPEGNSKESINSINVDNIKVENIKTEDNLTDVQLDDIKVEEMQIKTEFEEENFDHFLSTNHDIDLENIHKTPDDSLETITEKENWASSEESSNESTDLSKEHVCHICQNIFEDEDSLEMHVQTHTETESNLQEPSYTCKICNKTSINKSSFKKHMQYHTAHKPYSCDICSMRYLFPSQLAAHMRNHTKEKQFECNVCNSKFMNKKGLARHKKIHTGEKPFECSVCHMKFTQSGSLNSHMTIHTGERKFACSECDKKFVKINDLKRHMVVHAEKETFVCGKPYICGICNKTFRVYGSYHYHLKSHNEKQFECEICNKKYTDKTKLKAHMIVHNTEQPYKCNICISTFKREFSMIFHMKKFHKDEKDETTDRAVLKCDICNKRVFSSYNLSKHKLTHLKQPSFDCKMCDDKFCEISQLIKHIHSHSSGK